MGSRRYNDINSQEIITQDELKKYQALMRESKVDIDDEALAVVASLLRLGVSPDDMYFLLKEMAPACGLLKRFKIKQNFKSTSSSTANDQ